MSDRPRLSVRAGTGVTLGNLTTDAISNFVARIGLGQQNQLSGSTYNFLPISRIQQLLEYAYRGSWIIGAAVDCVADDMTRAGVQMNSDTDPDDIEQLQTAMNETLLWQSLNQTIKWSRLYGGALMVMQIDGQDMATELDPLTVPPEGLKGFMVLDRWMVQQTFSDLVLDYGPDYGMPRFYDVVATAPFMPRQRIHYTRCVRMDGVTLPFRQKLSENGWGMSVVERLYDRLIAFDSGTMGAAQLLYKAYLRTYKVNDYRALVGAGGPLLEQFAKSMELMRAMQSNEGLTIIDAKDEFETHAYSFAGIPETLMILGQQISGALGIPLVRLFGQSPSGMNATGESDIRLYYDMINSTQEARLRRPLSRVFDVLWQSVLGQEPPDTWNFKFNSLRQLDETEKAELAERDAGTIASLHGAGIISTKIALQELKQSSIITGRFTNITEQDIADSENEPAPWSPEAQEQEQQQAAMGAAPGGGGPPGEGGGKPPGGGGALPGAPAPKTPDAGGPFEKPKGGDSSNDGMPHGAAYWRREAAFHVKH
jgi:phage-related protein (TIGR01555 family)